jgi:rhodanese-related sulfurtransferase
MEKTGNNIQRSLLAFLVILLILIIGYVLIMPADVEYDLSSEEMLEAALLKEYEAYPEDVAYIADTEDKSYFIVDIRDPHSYQNGHVKTAVNIPLHDLLEKDNIKLFDQLARDSVTVILYGHKQLDANGGWMLLRQLGYSNIEVMLGGYDYYSTSSLDLYDLPDIPEYMVEEQMYDYAGIMEKMSGGGFEASTPDSPELVVPVRKKKKSVVEGGC